MSVLRVNSMYVDGFVLVVPKKKVAAYMKMAKAGSKIWKDHGALQYFECMGDDLVPTQEMKQKLLTFPKMTTAKKGETVWFSFIIFKSKAHRDAVNKKVMADPRLASMKGPMPFDLKRMAYGGFKAMVKY